MKLEDLIKNVTGKQLKNFENVEISGISYNSKTTKKGDIFVCLKGEHSDGHEFAKMAYENGASAFFCEHELDLGAPQVIVPSTRHQIAEIAAEFYEYPSRKTNLIGVT